MAFAMGFISHRHDIVGICLKLRIDEVDHVLHLGVPKAVDLIKALSGWLVDSRPAVRGCDLACSGDGSSLASHSPTIAQLEVGNSEISNATPRTTAWQITQSSSESALRLVFDLRSNERVTAKLSWDVANSLMNEINENINTLAQLWNFDAPTLQ